MCNIIIDYFTAKCEIIGLALLIIEIYTYNIYVNIEL